MNELYFINDKTTVDDIIEHILFELNNKFAGSSLAIHHYCVPDGRDDHEFDKIMNLKVRERMLKYNLVRQIPTNQNNYKLTGDGAEIYSSGGWKKHLIVLENEKLELKKQQNKPTVIYQGINNVVGDNNKNIIQGRDFRENNLSNNASKHQPADKPQKNVSQENWDRAKTIATILAFFTVIIGAITKYLKIW